MNCLVNGRLKKLFIEEITNTITLSPRRTSVYTQHDIESLREGGAQISSFAANDNP